MRHSVRGRKFNRTASHRKMMFRNMVTELFRHERIKTTTEKAKEARSLAERLITYAKAGDLNSRRMAARRLTDPQVLRKLFDELGPRYADRPGGYTRVLKLDGPRRGDNADVAILELVGGAKESKPKKARKTAAKEKAAPAKEKASAKAPAKKTAAKEKPDDLTKIEGVGPKIAEVLHAAGVTGFADLASRDVDALKEILTEAGPHYSGHQPDTWPRQAELAAAGKWDELKTLQEELHGGVDKSED